MTVKFHPHARERMAERGASERDVTMTIEQGESFPASFGRVGFRRNFAWEGSWRGRRWATKQVEVYAAKESDAWLVITVIVRYF